MCNEIRASGRESHFAFTGSFHFSTRRMRSPPPVAAATISPQAPGGIKLAGPDCVTNRGKRDARSRTPQAAPHRAIATYRAGLRVAGTRIKTGINFMEVRRVR